MPPLRPASAWSLRASGSAAISSMAPKACWTGPRSPRSRHGPSIPLSRWLSSSCVANSSSRLIFASYMGVSKATASRVLRRAGLSKLSDLRPQEVVQRYEREAPGDLLHIDIKKLGRFEDVGHRITGDYRKRTRHVGWEYVFVAVDDHSRIA